MPGCRDDLRRGLGGDGDACRGARDGEGDELEVVIEAVGTGLESVENCLCGVGECGKDGDVLGAEGVPETED